MRGYLSRGLKCSNFNSDANPLSFEGSFPSRPESSHENPEEFVEYPKSWPCALSLEDSKLLPKN
jgi:hypothetical protein